MPYFPCCQIRHDLENNEAAAACFTGRGCQQTGVRNIAAGAKASPGILLDHPKGKAAVHFCFAQDEGLELAGFIKDQRTTCCFATTARMGF